MRLYIPGARMRLCLAICKSLFTATILVAGLFLLPVFVVPVSAATPLPYDEAADAQTDLQHALNNAKKNHKSVLIVFGANWCPDCRALDAAIHSEKNAELIAREFTVVKIDVGNFNRNLDLAAVYGNPIARGIPAAVLVSEQGEILYATRAGELANARRMSESGIYDFLSKIAQTANRVDK
jgi:protein disulfide-isomerase